jgi:cytochrome c oxidase subunit 4
MLAAARLPLIWLFLLLLGGASLFLAHVPLGNFNLLVALTIAALMALTVIWGFMRVGRAPVLAGTFFDDGLFWLLIMLGLIATDILVRPAQMPIAG